MIPPRSAWEKDPQDELGLTWRSTDLATGHFLKLRHFPALTNPDARDAFRRRLKKILWLGPQFGPDAIEDRLGDSPPSMVARYRQMTDLIHWLPQAKEHNRLRVAAELVSLLIKAHAAGLVHGGIREEVIAVDDREQCRIDFLSGASRHGMVELADSFETNSFERDAEDLITVLIRAAIPSLQSPFWAANGLGRERAQLNQLIQQQKTADNALEDLDRWHAVLRPFSTNGLRPGQPASPQFLDSSIVLDRPYSEGDFLQSRTNAECGPVTQPADSSANDKTIEVELIKVDPRSECLSTDKLDSVEIVPVENYFGPPAPGPGDMLNRFRLDQMIGEGGMGVVYRGIDVTTQEAVAIKLLRVTDRDIAQALRRFRKEARLLQQIQNPFVTRLIEAGTEGGHHYLAMEFVDGTNLDDWLDGHGPVDESTALNLIADIARALVDAHAQGIIHRDLKPANVLLARTAKASDEIEKLELRQLRVKLSDFGIARQICQSESMAVTRAGALLGTPLYMSPEQCKSQDQIGPASDIYSLGVILYRLLTGVLPFDSDDPLKLVAKHCFDIPTPVQKRNPAISDVTADLVTRMLSKSPDQRPADAGQLIAEIERLLRGEPSPFDSHPHLPVMDPKRVWCKVFTWELASSAAQLWPYVSNTERLNRAAGLSSVQYRTEKDPVRGLRKFGSFKLAGMNIAWEEHPFEWIEGTRMGILREFISGPFRWFSSVVELTPLAHGGTRLTHTVRIEPRNLMGRLVAEIEAGWKGERALNRIYRRIDGWLQRKRVGLLEDPFEPSPTLNRVALTRLRQRLDAIVAEGVAPEMADKLGEFLKSAAPQTLAQIRPLELAEALGTSAEETLEACLVAARNELLVLRWDILCPTCRAPASTVSMLSQVNQHTGCQACDTEFQSNLANAIELVFQAHAEIRAVDSGQYCIGGPEHSPHVVTQLRLSPGERMEIVVPLSPGDYLLRGAGLARSMPLRSRNRAAPGQLDVALSEFGAVAHKPVVRAGRVAMRLTNDLNSCQVVRLERAIDRDNVVTAAMASAMPKFRELFPDQVFRRDLPVTTEDLSFLAVRILGTDELYDSLPEADAYLLIQRTMQAIEACVAAHRGAVIKIVGESLLASLAGSQEAVQAAVEIPTRLSEQAELQGVEVVCGVHRGPALVTTQNGRLDYFGTTVRTVEALAGRNQALIVLSDAIFTQPDVNAWLAANNLPHQLETASLPGGQQRPVLIISTRDTTRGRTP